MQDSQAIISESSPTWQLFNDEPKKADWSFLWKSWLPKTLTFIACGLALTIGILWGLGLRMVLDSLT